MLQNEIFERGWQSFATIGVLNQVHSHTKREFDSQETECKVETKPFHFAEQRRNSSTKGGEESTEFEENSRLHITTKKSEVEFYSDERLW